MATSNSVKKPNFIKERWDALEPARKKQVAMLGTGALVLAGAFMVISGGGDEAGPKNNTAQGKIANALMPEEGARDLGIAAQSREQRELSARVRQTENEMSRMKTAMERDLSQGGKGSEEQRLVDEIAQLRNELGDVKKQQLQQAAIAQRAQIAAPVSRQALGGGDAPAPSSFGGIRSVNQAAPTPIAQPASIQSPTSPAVPTSSGTPAGANPQASVQPKLGSGDRMYLPAGSILSGVLLSGVDAPSGKTAMKDPVPVLARIKHDAILANRFRADVKECFVLLETVGDMASERAMMRAITMTCVRRDKSIIEVPMAGYAVGEDGRAGLRGILVTKQGAVLGKAALAGFADGLSKAFGGGNSLSIGTGGTGISSESVQSGAMNGASSALDRISQWYLERADELNPTISIDSGRQISIVLTRGRELATLAPGDGSAAADPAAATQKR